MRKRRLIRGILLGVVAALAIGIPTAFYYTDFMQSLELDTVDFRFGVRGDEKAPDDLVVVGVDAETLTQLNEQWPFPRDFHAKVIDRLKADGAKVIAFDIAFSQPSKQPPRFCDFAGDRLPPDDCALIESSAQAKNVIFSAVDVGKKLAIPFVGFEAPPAVLKQFGARPGYTGVKDDPDGVQRHYYYGFNGLRSFAYAIVDFERGQPVRPYTGDENANSWIDFYGGPGSIPTIPYWKVYKGETAPGAFKGKTVVIGAVDPTLKDVFRTATSGDELMSGPELQAHAVGTVRRGNPLGDAKDGVNVFLIVLLGLVAPAASAAWRLRGLAVALVVGILFLVAAQIAFNSDLIVAVIYPVLALIIGSVGSLTVQYFTETRERRRTKQLFARFVPENVVDEVLSRTDDDLRIGGVQREGTVMFTDLRGFTSFAERLPVDRVIEVLNRYLGSMSETILDHGGTLVAFMGDGIMAVYGAPLVQEDHADRALAAALEMRDRRLPEFNAWLRESGLSEEGFRMGIGLNSGPVMSGNVGSERRLEYTAIGDTTNTSSRIESMTKGTPHQLLMAESTADLLAGDKSGAFFVDEFEVRGREQKIRLWSAPEPGSEPPAAASAETAGVQE